MEHGNPFNEQILGKYFVGREGELQTFEHSLAGLAADTPSHAFVAGLHGTGKTFFLDKLVELAVAQQFIGTLTSLDEKASASSSIAKILRATAQAVQDQLTPPSKNLTLDWDRGQDSTIFRQPTLAEPDSDAILSDLQALVKIARSDSAQGIVICIDEAQRLVPSALSALKNALQRVPGVLIVLSLRVATADGGARKAGRALLETKASEAEGDTGASRLFVTEYGMGPFATEDEARQCLTKRLEDNFVSFDPKVLRGIVELSERVPHQIIAYANRTWELAATLTPPLAKEELLAQVVREQHLVETNRAHLFINRLSNLKRTVLNALLMCGGRATVEQIVNRLNHAHDGDTEMLERAVIGELNDLTRDFPGLRSVDDHFEIQRPVDIFAIRLALEEQ